jgi:outer membrane protein OmpA-like peptidoglycan-associated protein
LSMALPEQYGNWSSRVRFLADIDTNAVGELTTKAIAKFDTGIAARQQTPIAETKILREPGIVENAGYVLNLKFDILSAQLSPADKANLDSLLEDWRGVQDIQISVVGHSDGKVISPGNRHLFADNYILSRARANSVASYVADALGLSAANLQVAGRGADEPVETNVTTAGRAANRRVEMVMSGIRPKQPSFLKVTQESSGTKEISTKGAIPGTENTRKKLDFDEVHVGMPASQTLPSIESMEPGFQMIHPAANFTPAIASTKIAVKHAPGQTVELTLNDAPVSNLNFEGAAENAGGTVAISRWNGVDLLDGENRFEVVVWNQDGSKAYGKKRTINFAGSPIRAEFVPEKSNLVADGKNTPVMAVRLFDRTGKPSRTGIVGNFQVNAPYRSAWEVENDRTNPLIQLGDRSPTFRVGADGIALLELEPTTRAGEVTVVLPFQNYRKQEIRAWLTPAERDWILVGFAEGTSGYNTLTENASAALAAGHEDGYFDEGRVAFFAKGSVKGEYLLTLAFDSDRDRDELRDRFETAVDPNAYYALYADESEQRFEAASQRKLYLKLERNQFYAMFGDYETGLSITDLTRYQRRFNGVKSEYRGKNFGFTAFAAETDQSFNRDEIRGDGTSGLYQLNNAPIIANSEAVRIEVRDRFDSGVVLSTQNLSNFVDYNLDTLTGTLYFKQPVPSRDLNFNPVFIVVEYESIANSTEDVVAGGRASMRSTNDSFEFGVTHVNDGTQGAEADLSGVDLRWQINDQTILKAEVAESNSTVAGVQQNGSASFVTLEHNGENVDVRAFIREVDDNFGVGYQSTADQGVRRLGIDARAKLGERVYVEGEAGWQQQLLTEDIRNLARAKLRYEWNSFNASVGVSHAEDKFEDGDTRTSDLAELNISKKIFDGKLNLRAGGSTEISKDAANLDHPTSFVLGADYRIRTGIDLVAEYEDARGRDIQATMTRVGVRATPWSRAQINTSVTNEVSEFGPRLFSNVGLIQGFQLNDQWSMDIGLDQSSTILDSNARPFDPDRELATGSFNEDFLAAYAGALYTAELWSANMRVEHRNSDSEERNSALFGWYRQPTTGHGLSAGLTVFRSEMLLGQSMTSADLKLGWAYRLADSKWSFLDRVDLVYDDLNTGAATERSWRLINNFNANRRFGADMQMSLQYAFKYVRSEFGGNGFNGFTDLIGFDLRRGLGGRWDIGANTSIYHSYQSKVIDYGAGLDVGFNLATNMWITLGYNFAGFHDEDFSQARYTAHGPYLRFSIKADQRTLKDIAGQR